MSLKVLNKLESAFGLRVLIALKHKGLHYEYQEEDLANKSQLLLESNPTHKKIPVLIHNGKPICESLIIVQYIDENWPSSDKPILPKDPYDCAIACFWADYVDRKVFGAGAQIVSSLAEELVEQGKKDLIEAIETLEGVFRNVSRSGDGSGGLFFGGHDIGFVDIALASLLSWLEAYGAVGGFNVWEESKCPHLSKWAEAVVEYPSVKEALSMIPTRRVVEFAHGIRKRLQGNSIDY
ncbi:hypothetical protein GOP47_0027375 [Adiantum capillus-veneris]|nr:hypothetical protein GOP47_0027375 [Adiantum capillus-veneris]